MPSHSVQLLVGILAYSHAEITRTHHGSLVYASTRVTGVQDLFHRSRRAKNANPQETIVAVARGGFWGRAEEDDEKWEYYTENEGEGEGESYEEMYEYEEVGYGKVQDIDSEFLSDSGDDVELEEGEESIGGAEISEQVDESLLAEETAIINEYEADSDNTDDDVFLLSTPIPTRKEEQNKPSSSRNFLFASRKTTTTTEIALEPLSNSKTLKKQNRFAPHDVKQKNQRRKTSNKTNPSSSGASFISPVVYKLSSIVQDVSSASINARRGNARNIFSQCINSLSKVTSSMLQPFYLLFSTGVNTVLSNVSKLTSIVMALISRLVDTIWYGSVNGVTTTGISRSGGLVTVLKSPYLLVMSSIFMIGLTTLLVWKRTQELNIERSNNAFVNAFRFLRRQKVDGIFDQTIEEDEYDSDDSIEPPSTEEELEFLGSFKAANPTSRERISKTIAGGRSRRWGFKSQNPAKQRQRSIKSIQKWWRQRPSTSVTIIEPKHVHNQQPMPSSQRISQLQNQLAQSEQERAVLQLDVQRLQHRLQKAHHDARAIVAKNEWLEKQQSKADKILAKAVEVERRKANSDMEKVRDTMKGVLERERMLMRGRLADNLSSRASREEDTVRNTTYIANTKTVDEGRSNNQEESDGDEFEEGDSIWAQRQRAIRRRSNNAMLGGR